MLEYLLIIVSVALFGIQHSGLSALRVKNRIIDRFGKEGYATIFNITSFVTFGLAFLSMWYWDWFYFLTSPQLIQPLLFMFGVVLLIAGVAVTIAASRVISVSTVADMRTDRMPELITDGIYARIRHPLYLATLLLFVALAIYPFTQVIVFSLSLSVYILIGAYLEELKLIEHYGQSYLDYRKQAGFLLPHVRNG